MKRFGSDSIIQKRTVWYVITIVGYHSQYSWESLCQCFVRSAKTSDRTFAFGRAMRFLTSKGTIDQIWVLQQVIEKAVRGQIQLTYLFC